jgi:putative transposase
MPKNLKRYYGRGDLHFITFSCYRRQPFLGTPQARNVFISSLAQTRACFSFLLVGYVVMPEHIHLLISEPANDTPSETIMSLKHRVSFGVGSPAHFSDPRFYDFNVHSAYKRREKLNYMHMNPIKRGLVRNPRFWPWSSFLNYEKDLPGLISIDFVS